MPRGTACVMRDTYSCADSSGLDMQKEVMLEEQIKFSDDRSGDDGVFGEVRRNRPPVCSVCCQCVTSASCAIGCAKN